MTQEQVAAALGVVRETVGNWENGTSTPRNRMAALAELLEMDRGGSDVGPEHDDALASLDLPAEVLQGLSPSDREEVRTSARLAALRAAREIRGRQ